MKWNRKRTYIKWKKKLCNRL